MGRLLKKFFNRTNDTGDYGIIHFCKAEWGKDWYYAYSCYKKDGRFPYYNRRTI